MKTLKIVLCIVLLVLMVACAGALNESTGGVLFAIPSAQAAGAQSLIAVDAQPSATATPDYQAIAQATVTAAQAGADATSQAALQAVSVAQSQAGAAQAEALAQQQNAIWQQQTAVAALADVVRATADIAQAQVEQAKIKLTQSVLDNERAQLDLRAAQITQAAPALLIANQQAAADVITAQRNAEAAPWLRGILGLAVVGLFGSIIVFLLRDLAHIRYSTKMLEASAVPLPPQALPVVLASETHDRSVIDRIVPPDIDADKFYVWAAGVIDGRGVAMDEWETKDSPFVGYEYREIVHPWAEKNMLFATLKSKRKVLSIRGNAILKDMLEHAPHSPDYYRDLKMQENPTVNTDSVNTEAEGEGER